MDTSSFNALWIALTTEVWQFKMVFNIFFIGALFLNIVILIFFFLVVENLLFFPVEFRRNLELDNYLCKLTGLTWALKGYPEWLYLPTLLKGLSLHCAALLHRKAKLWCFPSSPKPLPQSEYFIYSLFSLYSFYLCSIWLMLLKMKSFCGLCHSGHLFGKLAAKKNYKEDSSKKKWVENTRTLRKEPGSKSLSRWVDVWI